MTTTLLQHITDACDEANIARPAAVIGSSDRTIQRMLTFSNREGRDLMRTIRWTILERLHTFTTTASTAEYALPSDFDRIIPSTEWDRAKYEPLIGPLSPQRWQAIKSGLLGSGVVGRRYRVYRSDSAATRTFRLDPTPSTTGDTLAFEYISNKWCASTGGTPAVEWAADSDYTLLNPDLHTLGVVVRFKRANGLDFASEADEHANMLAQIAGQDRPSPVLSLAPSPYVRIIGPSNLPDSNLGS